MESKIWKKLSKLSWVRKIMNDIQKTLKESWNKKIINMSAWNPLVLDELVDLWEKHTKLLIKNKEFWNVVWRYGSTKWYEKLLEEIPLFFKRHFSKDITQDNILVTPWSQSLYFYAINSFAWEMEDWTNKKIFLPQCPEYTWYTWMAMKEDIFVSRLQKIEKTWKHKFKYVLDTSTFPDKSEIWAIIISRPCNPTWNIISEEEMKKITDYVDGTDIPIFLDSAYAPPVPNLAFADMETKFTKNIVYCMSFSKAWLPWERVWIAVWDKKYLQVLEAFQANSCIMSSRFWQALIASALQNDELFNISNNLINPCYKNKFELINSKLDELMPDDISWYVHESKGWMFSYLWFENLPITDDELYEILKDKWVLFVPWNPFFTWIDKNIKHTKECLRLSITVEDEDIVEAIKILSYVIKEVYSIK